MALGQLQMGGSVYPTVQQPAVGSTKPLDIAQQAGRKLGQWQEGQAEDIMLRNLMGQPAKQSFLDKLMGKEVPAAAVTQQPREMFHEGQKGDLSFNPQVFESFRNKFNMTNLQNQMLNQATDPGVRRKLMGMLHEKLPAAIQKQQRTDSMELLEKMYSSQLARLGDSDKANDALSKMIENDPRARAWFDDYVNTFKDEEEVPALVSKIRNKLGLSALGTGVDKELTKTVMNRIRQTEGMKNATEADMKKVNTEFQSVKKQMEDQGYVVSIGTGGDIVARHPQTGDDYSLNWNPYTKEFFIDRKGFGAWNEMWRGWGFDAGNRDPSNLGLEYKHQGPPVHIPKGTLGP